MSKFLRPTIRAMVGYTPGEQPREAGIIKLNTNENPYPPSPRVLEAIQQQFRTVTPIRSESGPEDDSGPAFLPPWLPDNP